MSREAPASARAFLPLLAVVLAVLIQLPILDRWFGLLDEGYMLALADDITHGQVLYRDVYVDAPFPGAFYALAGWFSVFGSSIWASRLLALVVFAAFTGCSVLLASRLLPTAATAAFLLLLLCYRLWAFPHWQVYSYSSLAVMLLSAAAALLARPAATTRARTLVAAGMFAGTSVLAKQDYGLAVTGALGLVLLFRHLGSPSEAAPLRRGFRDALWLAAGSALVIGPVFVALALAGVFPEFLRQTLLVPLRGAASGTYVGLPDLRPLLHQDPVLRHHIGSYLPAILLTLEWERIAASEAYRNTIAWDLGLKVLYYAPLALWALAAIRWGTLAMRRGAPWTTSSAGQQRLLLLAYAGGFLLAFNRPRDWVHLMMIYPPAVLLGCVLAHDVLASRPSALRRVVGVCGGIMLAALVVVTLRLGAELRTAFQWPVPGPHGGVYTDARHGPLVEDVLQYLERHAPPGAPVPVYPTQPMLGFLAGRDTAAGFHVIWPFQAADRDARIIADLEQRRPPTIVYSLSQYAHLHTFRENAPRLFDYLVDRYELTTTFSREHYGPLLTALTRDDDPDDGTLAQLVRRLPADGGAAAARWPFADVLAVRVATAAAPPTTIPFVVPADATRLAFRYGINPDRWLGLPDGPYVFTLAVDGTLIFRGALDPAHTLRDRRWAPGSIDLMGVAGRTVTLGFSVQGPATGADDADLAGWARLRLERRPNRAGPP